jgi:hypothetical protein
VCQRPLCAECLWYAESGERLCPVHGELWQLQGKTVQPPERYAAGIAFSQISAAEPPKPQTPYQGNSNDLNALLALMMGIASVLACYGFWYLLPFVAFLLGLVAWVQARDALNPKRTKWLAGGAMISSGVLLLAIFALVTAIMMCAVFSASITSRSGPPPTPYFYATPTP